MDVNRNYRVRYQQQGMSVREMVASYIAETDDTYIFSLRPIGGTTTIPKKEVKALFSADGVAKSAPKIFKGDVRVLS